MKKSSLVLFLLGFSLTALAQGRIKTYRQDGIKLMSTDFAGFAPELKHDNDTIYVVNFWATWCASCIKELPFFEKIDAAYKDKKVKVLLVSLDMNKQVETTLIPFIKRKNLKSAVMHLHDPDADAWISKVDPSWSGALPATVIYTKGRRKFFERSFTYEELENEVKQFIE